MPRRVLLDICALTWLANASPMHSSAISAIRAAATKGAVHVSLIATWAIACLTRRRTGRPLQFLPEPKAWFAAAMRGPGIRLAPFTAGIAVNAEFLPGEPHRDPADCALIATVRHLGLPLVTRDARILAYAYRGHVEAIAC